MADINIQLPELTATNTLLSTDLIHVRRGGIDNKMTFSDFKTNILPSDISAVPTSREINTTAPLSGGGDLTSDLTLTISEATDSATGVVELATDAEAQAGVDTTRAITAAALASVTATESRAGLVERATDAEVTTGTDTVRYVSPKQVKDAIAAQPSATTSTQGKVELATSAETIAGVDGTRAVTPAGLVTLTATSSRAGLIEIATDTEATTGTDTVRAINAKQLLAAKNAAVAAAAAAIPTASTSTQGKVELATTAETQAGSDATRAVTPQGLAATLSPLSPVMYGKFNGVSGIGILGSYNVGGISRLGVGHYRVTFATPRANANYSALITPGLLSDGIIARCSVSTATTTYFEIKTGRSTGGGTQIQVDCYGISFVVFG